MLKIRRMTAVFLLAVFSMPTLFQPLHILWHHSVSGYEYITARVPLKAGTSEWAAEEDHFSCPLCEFQFSTSDKPETAILKALTARKRTVLHLLNPKKPVQRFLLVKSSRASPSFSF
ncbi:MAG: hypothetical protein LKK19_02220 [Bacteroidales bacterium]|jgi:rubredoxin|nr:hypothetical protein [Bacteroidales bacterium]MCI2121500.1 hypothetical protein [Bacteroidales bacterium]MCI2145135.1 hypothetical protein [Bacteroidales bacterium]